MITKAVMYEVTALQEYHAQAGSFTDAPLPESVCRRKRTETDDGPDRPHFNFPKTGPTSCIPKCFVRAFRVYDGLEKENLCCA